MRGIEWNALKKAGWLKLGLPERYPPSAGGGFPRASGKCEFYSEWLEKQGVAPLPFYNPPVEAPGADTELARKYPLAFISDRKSTRLNSSHSQISYAVFCLKKKKKNQSNISDDKIHDRDAPALLYISSHYYLAVHN